MLKSILQSAPVQAFTAWLATRYVVLAAYTIRWRIEGANELTAFAHDEPRIVVFWHETMPAMPIFWLNAKHLGLQRRAVVLASRHRDGQLIARAVEQMGVEVVAGSSSRGGAAGLRALIKALADGAHVGLTPDGPRGPRRVAAAGVAQLAALSGVMVMPCAAAIRPAIQLNSWDKMRLPLPFSKGVLVCGAPISVGREAWQESVLQIELALNRVTQHAEALL